MPGPGFKAAPKKGPGRKKGVPNKITQSVRDMILGALEQAGGEKYLLKQAKENPGPFMTLVGKILPTQITGDKNNPLAITNIVDEDQAKRIAEAVLRRVVDK
jgi:hypothetical protein